MFAEPLMRTVIRFIILLALILSSAASMAQSEDRDVCILQHLNVTQISGRVVAARSDKDAERLLRGAIVELRHIADQDVIDKTFTDENGNFEFRNIAVGSYSLAAKPPTAERPALFATAVEVRVETAKASKQTKEIVLALGWKFEGCHGGYAQVRKKQKID